MNYLVSIIVPIYNKEKFLHKLIDSIINQTYKNIEIILVDDGSLDNSLNICYEYNDDRIKVISKKNGGVSSARNIGLDNASGDYIAFIDGDDYVDSNYIYKLVSNIKDYDICECSYNKVDEDYKIIDRCILKNEVIDDNYKIIEDYLNYKNTNDFLWNKLFKKDVINDIRFDNYKCSEDFYFILKVLNNVKSKITISNTLYNYVINDLSVGSEKFSIKKMDSIYAREKAYLLFSNNLKYLIGMQILYQCSFLYDIADIESKKNIKEIFIKYFKCCYKVKGNIIKKIYRIIRYGLFYLKVKVVL